ncbi:target of Nesh-SH3 [Thamnophis elegans]|nr:target of Nesh-SH3 [Thamnophis elegans]
MISRLVFLLFCGHFAQILGNAGKLPRVKKHSLKVQINVTSDAVCMRYIRPTPMSKLEGFVLGYGSNFFSNQYIPLPSNGKMYMTEVDAEPRYLIAVRPVSNNKKSCSGKTKTQKPLQLVIGTLTPTSVFLSWGILVNPKHDWTTMNNCPNDRFYTVRYREKDKKDKWILQLCPTTETVVDNLKPNTIYEFGVKDNTDDGIWSKSFIYKMVIPGKNKENGELQNNYKLPKIQTQFIPDSKAFIPVKVIKQVLQNITHRTQSEILKKSPLSGPIIVHLIVPDFNATKQKPASSPRLDIFEKPKQSVAKNKTQKWLPESKTSEVKEITSQSQTAMTEQNLERSKPTAPGVSKDSAVNQAHTETELESSKPSKSPMSEMPLDTLDLHKFLGLPKARPSLMPQVHTEPSVSKKIQPVPLELKTPVPKTIQTKSAVTNEATLESFPSKTSKTLDWPRATLAPSEIPITLKWKVSATPERWHDKPAEKESQQKTTASSFFKIPELPRTTMVPREQKIPVSKPQFLPPLEEPKITLAVTNKLIPLPASTKISVTDGHPVATMASKEINPVPSKSKEFDYTKPEEPDRKFVSTDDDNYLPKLLTTPEFPITKHAEDDNYLPKVLTTSESPITKPASHKPRPVPTQLKQPDNIIPEVPDMKHDSYKASPVPPKYKQPDYIMPALPDKKHVSTEDDNYLPKIMTTPDLPITKSDSYKPSLVPPKYKEPNNIMSALPDKKHVSTVDDKYLPKVLTTSELPITKPVSTEDDNYLPKVMTTPDLPITKSDSYKPSLVPPKYKEPNNIMSALPDKKHVSYEPSPAPSKFKESGYITAEVPDRQHVSTEDDNYLPKVMTTPDLPITKSDSYKPSLVPPKYKEPNNIMSALPDKKHVSTVDDKYLPKVLTTSELPITKPVSYEPSPAPSTFKESGYITAEVPGRQHVSYESSPVPPKIKESGYIIAEVPDRKNDSYKPSPVPPKYKEPNNIMSAVPDKKHVSTVNDKYLPKVLTMQELPVTKPVSYQPSPVPTKFKEPGYITAEVPDRKHDSYKPSLVPPKYKEPDNIMPAVPDKKHVSTEEDNYLPKVFTTPDLPITKSDSYKSSLVPPKYKESNNIMPAVPHKKHVSTVDDKYLPKVLTTPELPITKPVSYEPSPIPSKVKQPGYIITEVPEKKHVSAMDGKYLPKVLTTPDLPITKSVSTEGDNYLPKDFNKPELPISKSVSTEDDNYLPKVLTTPELPITKSVSYEPSPVPSKFKEPGYIMPEVQDRKHVSTEDDNYLPKVLTTPELLLTKPVSYEPSPVPSKFKQPGYIITEVPEKKHVSTIDDKYLPKVLTTPDLPITKPASYDSSPDPSKIKEPNYIFSEVPERNHVLEPITFSNELLIVDTKAKHHVSITETTISPLLLPKSAPKETHQVPTRPKTSSSPDTTPTKSSLNIKHDPSKPKNRPGEKTQQSKPEIIPFSQDFITTMVPVAPEKTKETLDPKETRLIPSKPKSSDKQERNKTKPASSKLNNKVTVTKTPRLRKVVHRTTPAPPKIRTPGGPSKTKKPRDEKLKNEDVTKPLPPSSSTKSSISVDSTIARKKPDPATLPGTPRPPLAPARPTPIRRRPLPPNNVTGKPGRSGNVLMPRASSFLTTSIAKPTWPSSLVKTNSPKKLPTAAASPNYNNPMFSSIPTTETDIAGTPRYTGDHVKYLKKEDDVPCSITDSMQHFSSDTEDNRDIATSPPKKPPTNLTVVTVEGCSSFVILDWKPPENETVTGYKVVSTENGGTVGKDTSIITTNQTHSTVENLKPNTSYEFVVIASNPLGDGPSSESKPFRTESADPRVTESISMGKDAIWTEVGFNSDDDYSECKGKQYVKRTWYKKFVGVQLCNSLRYKIYLSDSLKGKFYNIGDQRGHGEDHCQFVDSYLDGKTGQMLPSDQLPSKDGYFRAVRQEPVHFGKIGAGTHNTYVHWYECGTTIPGKW